MAITMTVTPPDGSYEPPSKAAVDEFKTYGLSDFDTKLCVAMGVPGSSGLNFEVFAEHFVEDCYVFDLAPVLDEYIGDLSDPDEPTQEAVDQVVAMLESEIAALKERMAARVAK